jgi:uncharacterized membrane protein YhaH (DUF805 family)
MGKFFSYFENFAFKAFKFDDRATPLEYWAVMPVIWLLILAMVPGDARAFWGFLLAREIPPLNPFYYESLMLFAVTFIPRLALTVRRLHDSGKSWKWAKLPFISFFSSIYLILGLLTVMAEMGGGGGSLSRNYSMIAVFKSMFSGNADSAWNAIFSSAAVLNAMGWDAVIAILAEISKPVAKIDIQTTLNAAQHSMKSDPSLIILAVVMISAPFVTALLHLFFMVLPTRQDDGLESAAPMSFSSLRKKGETSANPFEGYKYLYEKSPEQEAAHKMRAKQEIRSLYQQRVLGNRAT